MSVFCSLVVTLWERVGLLAFLCVMFSSLFVTFPSGVLCQMWTLIVLIPDLYLLCYFVGKPDFSDQCLSIFKRYKKLDIT